MSRLASGRMEEGRGAEGRAAFKEHHVRDSDSMYHNAMAG